MGQWRGSDATLSAHYIYTHMSRRVCCVCYMYTYGYILVYRRPTQMLRVMTCRRDSSSSHPLDIRIQNINYRTDTGRVMGWCLLHHISELLPRKYRMCVWLQQKTTESTNNYTRLFARDISHGACIRDSAVMRFSDAMDIITIRRHV